MAKTAAKKSSVIVKLALAAVMVYLLYTFIGLQIKINEKKSGNNKLDEQISEAKTDNERLTGILDAQIDDKYVEKIARDRGYVNADEKVYESVTN